MTGNTCIRSVTILLLNSPKLKMNTSPSDPTNGIKSHWATLNKIINKKKIFKHSSFTKNGVFVTNFQTKADIFNNHFVEQCSLINNDSVLPNFVSRCDCSLSSVDITGEKVLQISKSLDPKKSSWPG